MGRIYNHKKDSQSRIDSHGKHMLLSDPEVLPVSYQIPNRPPILDQGQIGSCGPNEISMALNYAYFKTSNVYWQPSRLYIYYFARVQDGDPTNQDTGIAIGAGLEAVAKHGVCIENLWPYITTQYTVEPTLMDRISGYHNSYIKFASVPQRLDSIKDLIYNNFSVLFGIQIFDSFESQEVAKTGVIPMPDTTKENNLGGHCVQIWGWDDATQRFFCSNSWGTSWGQNGYFTIPYEYVLSKDLCDSLWTVYYFH